MYVCLCGVMKERLGTLHNKEAGSTHSLQQCEREKKTEARWNRTIRISISPLSTGSDFWKKGPSELSPLIKERICSKQLYLNLSCLLLFQTQPPFYCNSRPNQLIGPCGTQVLKHWWYMSTMNQKEEGHRSNGDKGH